jgi:hypothetical protein
MQQFAPADSWMILAAATDSVHTKLRTQLGTDSFQREELRQGGG